MGNKKATPRYEIREWLGKFESYLLIMKGREVFRYYDKVLERLFAMFPNHTGLEQFTTVDIADYKLARVQQGKKELSIVYELYVFYAFWRWLMEDKGLPLYNPARAFKNNRPSKSKKINISLGELNRLLAECSPHEQRVVLNVIQGVPCPKGKPRQVIRDAAARAGLPAFDLYELKLNLHRRLNREIIEFYCQQLLRALPLEPKLDGNAFATIEGPSLNERPPICHGDHYPLVVNRVNEQEPSPEGQSPVGHS